MFQKVKGQDKNSAAKASAPPAAAPTTPPPPAAAAPSQPAPAAASPAPSSAARNILSTDVEIKGTVKFENDLVVDGKIEGDIKSQGSLTIGENALIKAEIKTRSVVIYGKCHGNITVTDRVEIKANAEVVGDIQAGTLSIEAGAIFVGKSTVGTPKNTPAAAASSSSSSHPTPSKGGSDRPQQRPAKA